MSSEIQCDRHIGSAFPPRCGACETLTGEYRQLGLLDKVPAIPRRTRTRSNDPKAGI